MPAAKAQDAAPRPSSASAIAAPAGRILVVDDEEMVCRQMARLLRRHGYEAACCLNAAEALEYLARTQRDVVVTDVRMPGMDGLELLARLRTDFPDLSVVVVTAHGNLETAERAMELGAVDYLEKPCSSDELRLVLGKAFNQRRLCDEVAHLRDELGERYGFDQMVSREDSMRDVFATIARVAPNDATVLITGETGTGKELVARSIHYNSPRRDARFLAINCAALPDTLMESELFGHQAGAFTGAAAAKPGIFEVAHGGTLLLDEIGNVSPAMQTKLLRTLETGEYTPVGGTEPRQCDVRVLAATNVDLEDAVERGDFRQDLYYRVNVVPIHLPPLRRRIADIPLLVDHFLQLHGPALNPKVTECSRDALRALARCPWPGNIRELEHVIQRALIMADGPTLLPEHLPQCDVETPDQQPPLPCNEFLPLPDIKEQLIERLEQTYLDKVLRMHGGNVRRTAEHAGLSERSVHAKIKKYGLTPQVYR
jgi:DNA-binding NtrC family response regulator